MSEPGEFLCLDSLPEAVIVADASGRVLHLNRLARGLFGHDGSAQTTSCLADFLPGFDPQATADGGRPVDCECARPDGTWIRGEVCAAADGARWFVCIRESPSQAGREGLAETALEQQRAFFSLFNHDVRQSLQAIQFLSETLAPNAPETVAIISEIVASVRRLLDTVLRLNDTGALVPAREPCALAGLLESLRLELAPMAQRKGLTLEIGPTSEEVDTDPVLFRELLQNLVGNAIRYTRQGGVRIDCRSTTIAVRIEVSDTGVGMTETQLERLLAEPRGKARPSNAGAEARPSQAGGEARPSLPAGGTGLGLVIVKRLADLLGYRVEAASRLGQGSSFAVTMPRTVRGFVAARAGRDSGAELRASVPPSPSPWPPTDVSASPAPAPSPSPLADVSASPPPTARVR
jgi:signal transduction histidine kinase